MIIKEVKGRVDAKFLKNMNQLYVICPREKIFSLRIENLNDPFILHKIKLFDPALIYEMKSSTYLNVYYRTKLNIEQFSCINSEITVNLLC